MATKEVTLKYPIKYKTDKGEEKEKTVLTFGRLKAKHLKSLPDNFFQNAGKNIPPNVVVPLIAGVCDISLEIADEIDVIEDLPEIVKVMTDFLGSSLPIGKK